MDSSLELNLIVVFILSYVIGSIPIAYWYGKSYGIDIFKEGSGNPGSTNIARVLGKKHGIYVFILDILKTLLAIIISNIMVVNFNSIKNIGPLTGIYFLKGFVLNSTEIQGGQIHDPFFTLFSGLAVILGHNFPFTTKFKGGKGITCTFATIVWFNVWYGLILFAIHKIIKKLTGYVSIASIVTLVITALSATILSYFYIYPFNYEYDYLILPIIYIISIIGIVRHKDNILRLEHGTENK